MYSFSGHCAASAPISSFMCLWAIYIFHGSVRIFPAAEYIGRSIVRIYKSLTDRWMWKLGLWLRNSFSGNICFEFSVLVLCSVQWEELWSCQALCSVDINCHGHGVALSTEPGDSFPARLFRLCKRSTLISGLCVQLGQHLKTDLD